ncbi:cell division protein FtsX [Caldovatus sp. SYSU G05006]|uniref:Cell division protein FtsX n=1 Tax=Caldovatus aquaticus TaxID=2865671 RepID=A0ABS7F3Q5_9PROT|nr:cell division protein FtsX [Caldovatus aquaticus]
MRRALADRLLPGLVAAMALLATLAAAGGDAAAGLAARWQAGAAAAVTVQLPPARADAAETVRAALAALPDVAAARVVDPARLQALLRPWLGEAAAGMQTVLPLPVLIELHLTPEAAARLARAPAAEAAALAERLGTAAPGIEVEAHGLWVARLARLAAAVRGVALAVLALVAGVAAAAVGVAVRAGLAARRDSVLVVHGLGAGDGWIAAQFARRAARLAAAGGLLGAAAAVPVLMLLRGLGASLLAADGDGDAAVPGLAAAPGMLAVADLPWLPLLAVPALAWAIGWTTAQITVRRWLRTLP